MAAPDTLFGMFEGSVQRHPGNVALEVGSERLTYAELAALAKQVAAEIAEDAPRSGSTCAGIIATPHVLCYAAYLAVLSLGWTVVPLSAAWPQARIEAVARASALTVAAGPDPTGGAIRQALDRAGVNRPRSKSGNGGVRPAYVMFTSGSTGRPKGVPITNGQAVAYVRHAAALVNVTATSRLSHMFALTFDPSLFDLFGAWSSGATVCVPDHHDRADVVRYVNSRQITHWYSVPSLISIAQRAKRLIGSSMPGLSYSQFAGEQLSLASAALWRDAAPRSAIWNMYGPTELTVTCAGYRLAEDRSQWPRSKNGSVPIGRVNPGHDFVLIDGDGRQAESGELCIRGPQRFNGYLDPRDDAGRFIRIDDGPSFYRTGDLVCLEDGQLVHLGRLDRQVKVGGYRVELGEVETAIRSLAGVVDAVAFAVRTRTGLSTIRAVYIGDCLDPVAVGGHLRQVLPPYLMPQRVTWMEKLPLNANGKTDVDEIMRTTARGVDAQNRA